MKRIAPLLLAVACAGTSAQVYQRIDPDGQVSFSDRPGPDAQPVDVAPPQTISPLPAPARTAAQPPPQVEAQTGDTITAYTQFTIVSPKNEEGVRANNGNVTIRLSLQPALAPNHIIELRVDGEDGEQRKTTESTNIELINLSRGRHTVAARVLDDKGSPLIKAGPTSFFVLRVAGG
jgi:hypothetical protein